MREYGGSSAPAHRRRKVIAECVIAEVAGQIPVMVHVGQVAPVLSMELAEHAEKAGANALSSTLPPFYPYTPQQIAKYWSELSAVLRLRDV